jgi:hypothetical protein
VPSRTLRMRSPGRWRRASRYAIGCPQWLTRKSGSRSSPGLGSNRARRFLVPTGYRGWVGAATAGGRSEARRRQPLGPKSRSSQTSIGAVRVGIAPSRTAAEPGASAVRGEASGPSANGRSPLPPSPLARACCSTNACRWTRSSSFWRSSTWLTKPEFSKRSRSARSAAAPASPTCRANTATIQIDTIAARIQATRRLVIPAIGKPPRSGGT